MTRSRLRSPTSKSTTTTLFPIFASAAPSAAVDVVLPTPPFPEVTTRTLAIFSNLLDRSAQRRHRHRFTLKPGLNGPAAILRIHLVGGPIEAVDGDQLRFELVAEDPRGRIAGGAGDGTAAKRSVDMDRPTGDD